MFGVVMVFVVGGSWLFGFLIWFSFSRSTQFI